MTQGSPIGYSAPQTGGAPRVRLRAQLSAAVIVAFLAAGCGSSGSASHAADRGHRSVVSIDAPYRGPHPPGLLGNAASAGTTPSYVPRGRIVADSGFRPQVNGFSFENYGNDAGPVNLTAANVEDLFGAQVCVSGEGASCTLSPPARHWMEQVNSSMANGHCVGFSVSALRFYAHNLAPQTYGASQTVALPVQGNNPLQSLIAEGFAYQDLPSVTNRAVVGTPVEVLSALISALRAGREQYTLGIIKPDGSGGHAITPFAVEDRGNGQMAILVYDNNFPDVVRAVQVNTRANSWRYVGGINPSDTGEIYTGDAVTKSMALLPTSPGEGQQPCPFCSSGKGGLPGKPLVIDRLHYLEVAITAKGPEHPHLLFVDAQGRLTGYVHGRLVNQIPGMQIVQNYSVQNWNSAPEPVYHLPLGHPEIKVVIDSSGITRSTTTQLQVNGAGLAFYVQGIHIAPGQQDAMLLPADDLGISYISGGTFPASPAIGVQFAQQVPGSTKARLITLATGSLGFAPGSPVTIAIRPSTDTAMVSSLGARPLVGSAAFVLSTDSAPVGGGVPDHSYVTYKLPLNGSSAQSATFQYLTPSTPQLPVQVNGPTGPVGRVLVPSQH
jgi:hypothetical protein